MAKKIKLTKTAMEFNRLYKNIRQQERYYKKKGISLPEISAADFGPKNRSGLAALKKYKKIFQQTVKGIQAEAKALQKEMGISSAAAYEIISGERAADVPSYSDVAIDNFYAIVDKWATRSSRETMYQFLNSIRNSVDDDDFARVLYDTAQEGGAMEELQFYHAYAEEAGLLQPLIYSMLAKFNSIGNLTRDDMADRLENWFSGFNAKGKYVKTKKL